MTTLKGESELFGMLTHALRPLDVMAQRDKPQVAKAEKADKDLRWHEIDDLGDRNWCLQVGYSVEWDDGNAEIWVFKVYLNTGQRDLELQLNEVDLRSIEAAIQIEEQARRDAEASERVYDRDDHGDWLYEQRKDREASK